MGEISRRHVRPGDELIWTAEEYNRAAEALEAFAKLDAAPPLVLSDRHLRDATPQKFVALLSGTTSPYSWTEQVRVGSAWVAGARTGTASAVEVNAKAGLGSQFAWLSPCGPGEWCFQDVRVGPPACTATLTVTVRDSCTLAALNLASVQVSLTGQPTQTGTTNASGVKSFTVGAAGSWSVQVSQTGYTTQTISAAVTCGATTSITVDLVSTTPTTLTVTVNGCQASTGGANALPGATVTAVQGGVTVGTGTSDASGHVVFTLASAATVTLTISRAHFNTAVRTVTPTCFADTSSLVTLIAAAGWICCPSIGCSYEPIPTTLTLTDPILGAVTLTYNTGLGRFQADTLTTATARDTSCANPAARTIRITHTLTCSTGATGATLTIAVYICTSGGTAFLKGDGLGGTAESKTATRNSFACYPVSGSWTATWPASAFTAGQQFYGTSAQTFTVTE